MASCKKCGEDGLGWRQTEDNRWKLTDTSGEDHRCKLSEVPIYVTMNGVQLRYREERIAAMTVDYCIQHGLDPYTTEFERVGDVLRVVKPMVVQRR